MIKTKRYFVFLSIKIVAFIFLSGSSLFAQQRSLSGKERSGDRLFVEQKFDKAMKQYEKAINETKKQLSPTDLGNFHLKVARLYYILHEYSHATKHFAQVLNLDKELLSVDDICQYANSYRFMGKKTQAEAVFLSKSYDEQLFGRSQRLQNLIAGLSMTEDYDDPHLLVKRLSLNTKKAEYWVGSNAGHPYYAVSDSKFDDPNKVFFHRTRFYDLVNNKLGDLAQEPSRPVRYDRVPLDLQSGPATFAPNKTMMVISLMEYSNNERSMDMVRRENKPFHTKLAYSLLKDKQTIFTRLKYLFPQDKESSYTDPFFLNDGLTLLFSSDMPGGYGGFDLYSTTYDVNTGTWNPPVNLGPQVNTEGNEIFPVVNDGQLIFSSDGFPGYGGYDIYSVVYQPNIAISGNVTHYQAPINSANNDYSLTFLDSHKAYFISDRNLKTKDDVYKLQIAFNVARENNPKQLYGLSESEAIQGGEIILSGVSQSNVPEYVPLNNNSQLDEPVSVQPQTVPIHSSQTSHTSVSVPKRHLLMSIYFSLKSTKLTPFSKRKLYAFLKNSNLSLYNSLYLAGYSDDVRNQSYNFELSRRRSETVANFLRIEGCQERLLIESNGYDNKKITNSLGSIRFNNSDNGVAARKMNSRLRRVDIYGEK